MSHPRKLALIPLLIVILASLACDPPPVTGITCLYQREDGAIIAPEEFSAYLSRDGGITWESSAPVDFYSRCKRPNSPLVDPTDPHIQYRYAQARLIERSEDGGQTWHLDANLSGTDARARYYQRTRPYAHQEYLAGPLDGLIDPHTGNVIMAMGYEGVLVRTPDGKWQWRGVGHYYPTPMNHPAIIHSLIAGQIFLGLLLAFAVMVTIPILARGHNFWIVVFTIFTIFASQAAALFVPISILMDHFYTISPFSIQMILLAASIITTCVVLRSFDSLSAGTMITVIIWSMWIGMAAMTTLMEEIDPMGSYLPFEIGGALLCTAAITCFSITHDESLRMRLIVGGVCFIVFTAPYLLWVAGIISEYGTAASISATVASCIVIAAVHIIKNGTRLFVPHSA